MLKVNAARMLDEEVFVIMDDVPTRHFDFVIKSVETHDSSTVSTLANAFNFLIAATSRDHFLLPGPRETVDHTADDILYNDILQWLGKHQVGWPKDEVMTTGHSFITRVIAALFPLTLEMLHSMSDTHNAGIIGKSLH